MMFGKRTYFVFRPFGRWGLGRWLPPEMVEQVVAEDEAQGDFSGPTRKTVLRRLVQLVDWEWRFGPWALVRLPADDRAKRAIDNLGKLISILRDSGCPDDADPGLWVRHLARGGNPPLPVLLFCPKCKSQHVDRDEWATRVHRTHLCEHCGNEWRASSRATVGIPGECLRDPHFEAPHGRNYAVDSGRGGNRGSR